MKKSKITIKNRSITKLPIKSSKRSLPLIPPLLSQDQKSNLNSHKDTTQRSLVKRASKSQIQSDLLKSEELKPSQKSNLASLQIPEKDIECILKDTSEKTVKNDKSKTPTNPDNSLNKTNSQQYNAEEPTLEKQISKKIVDTTESIFFKEESLEDEIKSLKGIIRAQTKAYSKMEEFYFQDTNCLKRENEGIKKGFKKIEEENNDLKSQLDLLKKNHEESNKNNTDKITELESKSEYYQYNLKEKQNELFQSSEHLRKLQTEKKNREEHFKELQKNFFFVSDINKKLEQNLEFQKREVKLISENLLAEKEKVKFLEIQLADYLAVKLQFESLEDSLKELQKSADFTLVNYNELKIRFSSLLDFNKETEQQLKIAKEKLREFKINKFENKSSKLRRTNTLVLAETELQEKDSVSRLSFKIAGLEEELQTEKFEKEKLNKDVDYLKKTVDEKSQIISRIQERIESEVAGQVHSFKFVYFSKINELGRRIELLLDQVKEKFKCKLCSSHKNTRFIGTTCQHFFCKNCAIIKDSCPSCSKSKLMKVKLLKNISVNYNKISESVSEIFLLMKSHN